MNRRFPDFGQALRRPFEVHENCFDCAELYDGCNAWLASKGFACADLNRLPDVGRDSLGQTFAPSRMQGHEGDKCTRKQDARPERRQP